MSKTKVIATIGPESRSARKIAGMINSGMRIVRLNLSHGTHGEHARSIELLREACQRAGVHVPVLLDLQGPKIRTGRLAGGEVYLPRSSVVELTTEEVMGDASRIPVAYAGLPGDVREGDPVLLDDGSIRMKAERIEDRSIWCRVLNPGTLRDHKGVNLPGVEVNLPALTEKDLADLEWGVSVGVDFVALSFVRKADDIVVLKERMDRLGAHVPVIAKLEKPQAIEAIDEILAVTDGVMVARGDLGVEMSPEKVPLLQKTLIDKANGANKPVITATQMLESMIKSPRPTRAEASDVANAILDGTDAIMLSGETAVGSYPVEAVQMMGRIAAEAERALLRKGWRRRRLEAAAATIIRHSGTQAIGHAACQAAEDLGAAAIVCFTRSGGTALLMSKFRPRAPIVAVTPDDSVARRVQLYWGVVPAVAEPVGTTDELFRQMEGAALKAGVVKAGDSVIMTAGVPVAGEGRTNFMKIHRVGESP